MHKFFLTNLEHAFKKQRNTYNIWKGQYVSLVSKVTMLKLKCANLKKTKLC
jgi:hypothetical protein